jgi:beta-fructofuranosidase
MPFYENGIFHLFYLFDARNTLPTFHPWHKVTTSDFATFTDTGNISHRNCEPAGWCIGNLSVLKREWCLL